MTGKNGQETLWLMPDAPEPEPGTVLVKRSVQDIVAHLAADFQEIASETRARKNQEKFRRALAALVFSYWAHRFGHTRALLDPSRERLLMARLQECNDKVSDLLWALDGARKDDWVAGRARHATTKHDDLETILRNRATIEKYGEMTEGFRDDLDHPMWVKYGHPNA